MEQRENEKQDEANGVSSQTDVASILARRVAVEMSDSDNENASDSEYDSDDWGDESTAWHKSKLLKQQKEYFFKSQESLATVIDNEEDEEVPENQVTPETEMISTPPATRTPTLETAVTTVDNLDVKSGNIPAASGNNPAASGNSRAASGNNPATSGNSHAASEKQQPLDTTEVITTASKKTTNV